MIMTLGRELGPDSVVLPPPPSILTKQEDRGATTPIPYISLTYASNMRPPPPLSQRT